MCVWLLAWVCVFLYTWVHMCLQASLQVCMCVNMCVHVCVCVSAWVSVSVHMHMCMFGNFLTAPFSLNVVRLSLGRWGSRRRCCTCLCFLHGPSLHPAAHTPRRPRPNAGSHCWRRSRNSDQRPERWRWLLPVSHRGHTHWLLEPGWNLTNTCKCHCLSLILSILNSSCLQNDNLSLNHNY